MAISLKEYRAKIEKEPQIQIKTNATPISLSKIRKEMELAEMPAPKKQSLPMKAIEYVNNLGYKASKTLMKLGDVAAYNVLYHQNDVDNAKRVESTNKMINDKLGTNIQTPKYAENIMNKYGNIMPISSITDSIAKQEQASTERLKAGNNNVENVITDIALAGGDMAVKAIPSLVAGVPLPFTIGLTTYTDTFQNDMLKGIDKNKAGLHALGSGLISGGIESITGIGASGASKALASTAGKKLLSIVPKNVANYLSKASNSVLGKILKNAAGEALEEGLEYDVQRIYQNLVLDENTPRDVKEQVYSMMIGGGVGGLFGGGKALFNKKSSLPDYNPVENKSPSLPNLNKTPSLPNMNKSTALNEIEQNFVPKTNLNSVEINNGNVISQTEIKEPLKTNLEPNEQYKDLGADKYNPDTYENMLNRYGAIEPGEKPDRIIDVPKSIDGKTKIRQFTRTAMESKNAVDDNMLPTMEEKILKGDFNYEVSSNKSTIERTNNTLKTQGYDESLKYFKAKVLNGEKITHDDIAMGERLIQLAKEKGDTQTAYDLILDVAQLGTDLGKAVQAIRILKKLTPEGQLKVLNGQIKRINQKYDIDSKLSENSVEEILLAENETQLEEAIEKAKQEIADQLPSTWVDKWNAWRYLSMLGNPRTHIRNIVGNAVFTPVRSIKNIIGAGIEQATLRNSLDRTKAILTPKDKSLKNYAESDFNEFKGVITGEGKYSIGSQIENMKTVFNMGWLENLRKFNFDMLENEDRLFLKSAYINSFAQAVKAKGVTVDYLNSGTKESQQVLNSIRDYATKEAQKATYRDASAIATAINNWKSTDKGTKLIGEGVIPFTKTPINVIKRGIEYSPIGLIDGVKSSFIDVKNGNISASEAIDKISSGVTGLGLVALGSWLASLGLITGGRDEDKKQQAFDDMQGMQNYALKIGNKTYTIDWGAPTVLPFFVGVEFYNSFKNGPPSIPDVLNSLAKITEPVFELSMMQGISNTIRTAGYSQQPIPDIIFNSASSYIGQAMPTLFGQIARTIDNTRRTTYTDKNSQLPAPIQRTLQNAQAKLPYFNQKLQPRLDNWGREEKKESIGDYAMSAFENFISPGYLENINTTKVDEGLQNLYDKTGENVLPSKAQKYIKYDGITKDLTAKEYNEYKKIKGNLSYQMIDNVINNQSFRSLADSDKVKVVKNAYDYANAVAKSKVSNYKLDGENKKIYEAEQKGIKSSDYLIYKASLIDNYKQADLIKALDNTNFNNKQKSFLFAQRYEKSKNNPFNASLPIYKGK